GVLVMSVVSSTPAEASTADFGVDDSCGIPNPPIFYYLTGPLFYWHAARYTGGPPGTGGICTMYTTNLQEYVNDASDNTSYWYLDSQAGMTGSYGVWAFIPS